MEIPIRQDITVLPADTKNELVGWTIYEYQGCEIGRWYENWINKYSQRLEEAECFGDLIEKDSIKSLNGIKVGDKVLCPTFGYPVEAIITVVDYDKGTAEAESERCVYPLEFSRDDRKCWVSACMINKAILNGKLQL